MKKILFTLFVIGCIANTNAQVPSYVPTNGLVAYYPFNGNANDESGNGNNGTVNGATLSNDRNGNANSAYYFSSSSCATRIDATVNTSSINSAFTISFWMMRVGNGCLNSRIWEFCPGPAGAVPGAFEAYWYNSTNIAGVDQVTSTSTVISTTTNALLDNNWINIIYSNNGLQAKLWVNGSLVDSSTSAGIISLATNFSIGRMGHASYDAFKGNIDDIGLWNRALTQQEITNLYNSNSSNECSTLVINTGVLSTSPVTYTSTVNIYPNP
ncbi:LamG-like jellyroll fold domain-containing protein, partial [Polaribacter sp.]|uniref:LamG-like jellyroll fold domain-containing protein n=1 Tax=Polaribacter sp. TaxID=1920175 RepID=UPI004048CDB1